MRVQTGTPRITGAATAVIISGALSRITRDFLLRRETMLRQLFADDDPGGE
jgi:hypothetical protein